MQNIPTYQLNQLFNSPHNPFKSCKSRFFLCNESYILNASSIILIAFFCVMQLATVSLLMITICFSESLYNHQVETPIGCLRIGTPTSLTTSPDFIPVLIFENSSFFREQADAIEIMIRKNIFFKMVRIFSI